MLGEFIAVKIDMDIEKEVNQCLRLILSRIVSKNFVHNEIVLQNIK